MPDVRDILRQALKNTDAVDAIVTGAVLNDWLEKLLRAAMRQPLPAKVSERLFNSTRVLYELAPKADIAFAMQLIDKETLDSLRIIIDIRNKLAHPETLEPMNLDSPTISALCHSFPRWKPGLQNYRVFRTTVNDCMLAISLKLNELTGVDGRAT